MHIPYILYTFYILHDHTNNINKSLFNHVVINCQFVHDTIEIESGIYFVSLYVQTLFFDHILLLLQLRCEFKYA